VGNRGDYIVERLTFELEGAGPVRGFLTKPINRESKGPAILYNHSHGGRLEIGASEFMEGRHYLLNAYGPLLARAGYVSLCIDMPCAGDRDGANENDAAKAAIWYGKSLIGQMLSDSAAALTYLGSRDDVDPDRIGAFGISMGSTLSYWLAAIEPRLKAIAHLCCYADYATLVELNAHRNHALYCLVPGLLSRTTTGEIAGLVAPRAQLICLGDNDELTPPLSIERALVDTRHLYEKAGALNKLEVLREPVAHQETPQMHERVMQFFAREL
jgi:dienelactone hydrolase